MKKIILSVIAALAIGQIHSQMIAEWAGSTGNTMLDRGMCDALVDDNLIFSSGIFNSTVNFNFGGGGALTSNATSSDMYITRHNSNASFVWVKQVGGAGANGSGIEVPRAIITSPSGNDVYVCGHFKGTTDFNYPLTSPAGVSTSLGGDDIFIARYNGLTGALIWFDRIGAADEDQAWGICFDNTGNLLVCGFFSGTVDFDPTSGKYTMTSINHTPDAFYSRYFASNGTLSWARQISSSGFDAAYGICNGGASSSFFLSGTFGGMADFDPNTPVVNLTPGGSNDYFVGRYTYTPGSVNYNWAINSGTPGYDLARDIAFYGNCVYITGELGAGAWTTCSGTYTNTGAGTTDAYLAAYDIVTGACSWAMGFPGSTGNDGGQNVDTDDWGYLYVTGFFSNTVNFDPAGGGASLTSAGGTDAFLLRYNTGPVFKTVDRFGDLGDDDCPGLDAHHNNQKLYITGAFTGPSAVDFDPHGVGMLRTSAGATDIFLAKYHWTLPVRMAGPSTGEAASVSYYPNPSSGKLFIDNMKENSVAELYSVNGEKLVSMNADGTDKLTLDLNNFADGIYMLRITNADGTVTTDKIILQR